jgi:hypothetical protein
MPLQNRVTPFGDIVALEGRGLVMGNRGILHDETRRVVRYSQVRRWLACLTEFRGRHRVIMRPHSYTELFFLDEATAFAAGHRPCAECRHKDYQRFRQLWTTCHEGPVSADIIDRQLHHERLAGPHTKRTYKTDIATLPEGAYIVVDDAAWLVWSGVMFAWSGDGYTRWTERPTRGEVEVLTPRSTVEVLSAGYPVAIHPSATQA